MVGENGLRQKLTQALKSSVEKKLIRKVIPEAILSLQGGTFPSENTQTPICQVDKSSMGVKIKSFFNGSNWHSLNKHSVY
jgi:hypothetical protein